MAQRTTFSGSSSDVPWQNTSGVPEGFGDQYARHIATLYDSAAFPLTAIAGTANDVTATVDPALTFGLVDGMMFTLSWAAANTGPMTLAINGASPVDVLDAAGGVMAAGTAVAGTRSLIQYLGGDFRVLTGMTSAAGAGPAQRIVFTTSGTLVKASLGSYPADHMVVVEAWGGGGGGASTGDGGGGGGGYMRREFRFADLPSSVTVSVGAGGSPTNAGGNSTFGSLLTAFGGGGTNFGGAGGGGTQSAGVNGSSGAGGYQGGGAGTPSSGATSGGDATGLYGGGGGGNNNAPGGRAVYGGAGGGGRTSGTGGVSLWGGNGGASGVAGSVRGGGGGRGAAGGRGEVLVWL